MCSARLVLIVVSRLGHLLEGLTLSFPLLGLLSWLSLSYP